MQTSIGKQIKQVLDLPDSMRIGFQVFVSGSLHPVVLAQVLTQRVLQADKLQSNKAKDRYSV